jgi:AraC family transcriptional regulator
MEYRIVQLDAFSVVGVKEFMSMENGENFTKIPQMWADLPEETIGTLCELTNLEPSGVLGVCASMHNNGFDYWIATATTKECPAGFEKLDIPAALWIVFDVVGAMPNAMQNTVKEVFNEWLPSSGYQHADAPEMEWCSAGNMSLPNYQSELWIPVIRR